MNNTLLCNTATCSLILSKERALLHCYVSVFRERIQICRSKRVRRGRGVRPFEGASCKGYVEEATGHMDETSEREEACGRRLRPQEAPGHKEVISFCRGDKKPYGGGFRRGETEAIQSREKGEGALPARLVLLPLMRCQPGLMIYLLHQGRGWAASQAGPLLQVKVVLHGVFTVLLCLLPKLSLTLYV